MNVIKYNTKNSSFGESMPELCGQNPDCFIKKVNVDSTFSFNYCAPKEVPGFDLTTRQASTGICAMASQKCTAEWVKGLGGWSCAANCQCADTSFAEQMNDMCISLGDCGTKANYIGIVTNNSVVTASSGAAPTLSSSYIAKLITYADNSLFKGKYIDAGNLFQYYSSNIATGIPGWLGEAQTPSDPTATTVGEIDEVSGVGGLLLYVTPYVVGEASFLAGSTVGANTLTTTSLTGSAILGPAFGAASGAFTGAAIGFAAVSLLLQYTGVGAGLPEGVSYGLMAGGATAGALIGLNFAAEGTSAGVAAGAGGGLFGGFSTGVAGATTFMAAAAAIAWIAIAVIIIAIVILAIIGIGQTKSITYKFTCNPWQAPVGGDDCSKCGSDGFPCSQYSCQSLGQTCQLINEGTNYTACVNTDPNDVTSPIITPAISLLPEGYTAVTAQNGVQIKSSNSNGCIPDDYETIPFGLYTNKYAQCAISSTEVSSYDGMNATLDAGLYLENHSLPLTIPSLESLGESNANPNTTAAVNIYVMCQDEAGNVNSNLYDVNFCISSGPDLTPPVITASSPNVTTVGINTTNINETIYIDKPADCSWSTQDQDYFDMSNNFTCDNDLSDATLYGWQCNANLPFDLTKNSSTYYVRCLDQPWLAGINDSARNANTQSYPITFTRVSSPLSIDSINVQDQNLTFGVSPASVEVNVYTSGGIDGTAECAYTWGNRKIDFLNTFASESTQTFQTIFPGAISLPITCTDSIGDVAQETANFSIILQNTAPIVSRIYESSGNLNIVTNNPSTCYYSNDNNLQCLFNINNATSFTGNNEYLHSTEFNNQDIYYVKCEDQYGNYPGDCSAVIQDGDFGASTI